MPKDVDLVVDSMPEVHCDRDKIQQVFMNLVTNAVEHGEASTIEVVAERTDNSWDILFKNDGKTIPDEYRKRILSTRFSTKKGGGHGLSIVKKIVEAHGWSITLDDTADTVFRIRIPRD
ncbi:HAMP domain-containing histidine kinase [Candidatus Thorarchaeota archaeon]|nr:MAG: HAMP domain-containing histidine kinase [Candidatus Thorarchaeota archaeon]